MGSTNLDEHHQRHDGIHFSLAEWVAVVIAGDVAGEGRRQGRGGAVGCSTATQPSRSGSTSRSVRRLRTPGMPVAGVAATSPLNG
jgi:hypothetical protein